jgi:hypothetical protein
LAISSSTRKAGPFLGNDATTVFPFAFKVFTAADLLVVNTSALGVESDLELDVDYTVSLNANQDSDPGGSVTRLAALPTGERLTITSDVAALQPLVLTNNGGFYPNVINDAFDKITIIAQQLIEQVGRSLKLPISSTASATLPDPVPNSILAWNSDADGFVNIDPTDLATVSGYADARVEVYNGDGVETEFEIDFNPGVLANLDISISGVTQVAGVDFSWLGTTITFATAPPNGTAIQVRYARPLSPPPALDAAVAASQASAAEAGDYAAVTAADRVQTGLDAAVTAADRVQTGLDAAVTAADRVVTTADRVQTGLDRVATTADRVQTGLDRVATTADRVQTGLDRVATGADRVQTGLDRAASTAAAATAAGLANMWPDTVTGLANTPADGYFSVPPSSSGVITIYQDVGGVATPVYYDYSLTPDHKSRLTVPPQLTGTRSRGFHIHKACDDWANGTRLSGTILSIGDSLGQRDYKNGPEQLARILSGWFKDRPVMYPTQAGGFNDGAGGTRFVTGARSTATSNIKTDYSTAYTGSTQSLAPGQIATYAGGADGGALYCNRIRIPMIRASGGPTFKIEIANASAAPAIASGSWVSPTVGQIASGHSLTGSDLIVDLNAAAGIEWVELVVTYGQWTYRLTNTHGSVTGKALNGWLEISDRSAINIVRFAETSNSFANEVSGSQTYMAPFIANVQPDVILICSDDQIASYQNFLPILEAAITAAGLTYKPTVILAGNPTNASDDTALATRTDYCSSYCASRLGWITADLIAITGGLAEVTREGVAGDGTHPWATNDIAYRAAWNIWAGQNGLVADLLGGVASSRDIVRSAGSGAITSEGMRALQAATSAIDTGFMTWSGIVTGTASVTVNADKSMSLACGATSGSKGVAYINETNPYFGRANGSRPLALEGGFSFWVKPVTANTTGIMRAIWTLDRGYNAAHTGALTGGGVGFIFENGTVYGIYWNGSAETKTATSHTLTTNQFDDFQVVLKTIPNDTTNALAEFFVNGVSLNPGGSNYRRAGSASALRFEIEQSSAAAYTLRVSPPKLANIRG